MFRAFSRVSTYERDASENRKTPLDGPLKWQRSGSEPRVDMTGIGVSRRGAERDTGRACMRRILTSEENTVGCCRRSVARARRCPCYGPPLSAALSFVPSRTKHPAAVILAPTPPTAWQVAKRTHLAY